MTVTQILILIISALAVLIGTHYFFYFSVIRFFSVAGIFYKNILFFAIFFPTLIFILTSFLARWRENILTRGLYFVSGFWLGLLLNLIMASIIVWLIILIFRNVNFPILVAVFFSLALIWSLYGVWNAFNPKIKNISVSIPNLPENWKNKKIVQLSDVHLGLVHRENFLRKIIEKINSVRPEMVVITGDLFDGMDGDLNPLARPLDDIQAEKGVYYITGNHEIYLGGENVFAVLQKTKTRILKDEVVDVGGLKLIGINYGDDSVFESLIKDFSGRPNILLHHSPTDIDRFSKGGVNLQLSGHAHRGQIFPIGYIHRMVYGKYFYGLHQIGNFTLYTSAGAGTWGPAMRTGNTPEITVITLK
ncbi:MAG: metallophosphoesterase [Candidatus Parcubacteria bacterium]|nr:metallophosphoesterase [Candidatus Parcubacteria bacterium]